MRARFRNAEMAAWDPGDGEMPPPALGFARLGWALMRRFLEVAAEYLFVTGRLRHGR